jgi:hypothetical protein
VIGADQSRPITVYIPSGALLRTHVPYNNCDGGACERQRAGQDQRRQRGG